jgi:hypothetical protein
MRDKDARQTKQLPMCRREVPGIVSPGGENPDDRKMNSRREPTTKSRSVLEAALCLTAPHREQEI